MKKTKIALSFMIAAATAAGLGGCGETPQDAQMQAGKYRGKADTHPWDGAAQKFAGASFNRGDKASWDKALANRAQSQNEYVRIR